MSDSTAVITQEQLRQFFERASQAEQLAQALSQQIETIKASAAPQLSGSIDDTMRDTIVSRLKGLKTEVLTMEKNIKNLEDENDKLTKERDALEYRVKHMREALKQYSDNKK
mmetsp:Transcript_22467/g.19776  ORF Transcript_22467/g.19776 Transcript_22467/m.19776 type:complete len:112 (-) Transcript_22467:203-538(-)|eukprot:CAMPEP_0201591708 /NCGR_PEP_ID=MMETSP0190_2-20130828/189804_1 /ASSEMBLY_ACC=CAM_ASM_000263 /TAXON_ID=37353 /ORGANISM="Rosalina sp." /LENGTH=111 /DNA_ID=CAMNT_0048050151 /DNA_START=56 /DNA_END=391 /DNA_ORIENTATION=+